MTEKLSYGLNRVLTDLARQGSALSTGPNLRKKLMPLPITEGSGYGDIMPGATIDLNFSTGLGYVRGFGTGNVMNTLTFTRPSNGSYIGQDGLLKYGMTDPTNVLFGYDDFSSLISPWIKTGVQANADSLTAPDGSQTACLLVESNLNTNHQLQSQTTAITVVIGQTYTWSAYFKAGTGSRVVQIYASFAASGQTGGKFDLQNGTATFVTAGGPMPTGSITDVGDGWYRCVISWVATASTTASFFINLVPDLAAALNASYLGDGVSSVYVWGVRADTGSTANEYIYYPSNLNMPRFDWQSCEWSNKNIFPFSHNFTRWANGAGSSTIEFPTQDILAPDGTYTATKMYETTVNNNHLISYNFGAFLPNRRYTYSIYVKKGTRNFVSMGHDGVARTWFDVENGVVGTTNPNHTAAISDAGNGWWRCSVTFTSNQLTLPTTTGQVTYNPYFYINVSNGQATYVGDPAQYMYIWGAQMEESETPTYYMANNSSKNYLIASEEFYAAQPPWTNLVANLKTNLLASSNDFTTWTRTGVTATGLPGANVIIDTAGSSAHNITSTPGFQAYAGTPYTFSARVKKGAGANAQSIIQLAASSANFPNSYANFNVTTGTIENSFNCTPSIIDVGNGVYDLVFIATANLSSAAASLSLGGTGNSITNGRTPSWVAIANSDFYVYDTQVVPGVINESFVKAGVTNRIYMTGCAPILYSSPDGGNTALKLMGTPTSSNTHGIYQQITTTASVPYTFSVYAKAAEYDTLLISFGANLNNPVGYSATFNIASGTLIANGTLVQSTEINSVGDGWYRCSITTNNAATSVRAMIFTGPSANLNTSASLNSSSIFDTFTPDGHSGIFIWGGQVERANANTSYEATHYGIITPIYAVLKPSTVCNGILQERRRTNEILWCRDGTQSVWIKTNCTATLTETGIDGVSNTATRLTATGNDATFVQKTFLPYNMYASAIYVKRLTGNGRVQITMDGVMWSDFQVDDTWTRVVLYSPIYDPAIGIKIINSGDEFAVDYAQVERTEFDSGASAATVTTPIYTSSVTATRAIESITMPYQFHSSAILPNQNQLTLYCEYAVHPTVHYYYYHAARLVSFGDNSTKYVSYGTSQFTAYNTPNMIIVAKPGIIKGAASWGNDFRIGRISSGPRNPLADVQAATTTATTFSVPPGITRNMVMTIGDTAGCDRCIKRVVFIPKMLTREALYEMVRTGN